MLDTMKESAPPQVPQNLTGEQMLEQMNKIDGALDQPDLTPDASDALVARRKELLGQFTVAAEYAQALQNGTGAKFPNPLEGLSPDSADRSEEQAGAELTPEEQAYKDEALKGIGDSLTAYTTAIDLINTGRRSDAEMTVASKDEALAALEASLTPEQIRAEMAEIELFKANPDLIPENAKYNLEPGFDTVLIPNTDLDAEDETAVADGLQAMFNKVCSGAAYVNPNFHNQETAHKADPNNSAELIAVRVPRHLNVVRDTVAKQRAELEDKYGKEKAKETTIEDLVNLIRMIKLAQTGRIDTSTPGHDYRRFWVTYSRDVMSKPFDGRVSGSCVLDYGQVLRGYSVFADDGPSRALVVPIA